MARPRTHVLSALPLAYFVSRRWGVAAAFGAFAGGVLIDGDHLVDYAWTRISRERNHFIAPLHGWELAIGLVVLALSVRRRAEGERTPDRWLGRTRWGAWDKQTVADALSGAAAGMWLHMVLDVIGNRPEHVGVYSLLYRARHRFHRESTGWSEETGFHYWSELPWYQWWKAF
ncbi:MAG: hypothetical protein ACR2NO_06190 [Chloroflexota bacterium]